MNADLLCLLDASWISFHLEASGLAKKLRSKPKSAAARGKDDSAEKKPPRIFFFGEHRELALYRAHVLETMGYAAVVPRTKQEAVEVIRAGGFSAAILSYTLSDQTVKELADLLRQACADCPLLTISRSATYDPHVQPDAVVNAEEGPSGLISALRGVLAKRVQ